MVAFKHFSFVTKQPTKSKNTLDISNIQVDKVTDFSIC